jgi:hypothetical protein
MEKKLINTTQNKIKFIPLNFALLNPPPIQKATQTQLFNLVRNNFFTETILKVLYLLLVWERGTYEGSALIYKYVS